jgi:photosynthetic reaction center cytochrome c subunit
MTKTRFGAILLVLGSLFLTAGCERTQTTQLGYRGLGLVQNARPAAAAALEAANVVPKPLKAANPEGPRAGEFYENVQVLGDYSKSEFARTMASFKNWVAPEEGCGFCHNAPNYADDSKYTKRVAREMIRMTRHINTDWKQHVAETGVTCYTCHRGKPVPERVWFSPSPEVLRGAVRTQANVPLPTASAGRTGLPTDALTNFLLDHQEIRVIGTNALQNGNHRSIKQAKYTYAMMMVMSESLGVNCDYCHNTRAFYSWDQSRPQRATAWYGIRMARDLNNTVMVPLTNVLPVGRLGPSGDVPKIYCATCHQGVFKPLYGVSMVKDFPELIHSKTPDYVGGPPKAEADTAPENSPAPTGATPTAPAPGQKSTQLDPAPQHMGAPPG